MVQIKRILFNFIFLIFVLLTISIKCSSSIHKDYSGTQLIRCKNIKNITALDSLNEKYDGNIWKHSKDFLDITYNKENLIKIKEILKTLCKDIEILIPNLQNIIDNNNYYNSNHNNNNSVSVRRKRSIIFNWENYYPFKDIVKFLINLRKKNPKICKIFKIGKTFENRNLLVLRISENFETNDTIWIDGGIHAREWISPASVTYIANYLVLNWNSLPKKLKNKTWLLMPIVNPDGYEYSRTVDRFWRKNRQIFPNEKCVGVDLNRNFDIDWNSTNQSSDVCKETYKGPTPFSELESLAIKNFLTKSKDNLKAMLTYHSYGQSILWPWGYKFSGKAPNVTEMENVAKAAVINIKTLTGTSYTAARSSILGRIPGASDDWTKATLGTVYTYTIELRDKGSYGFVLPPSQIIPTAMEALEIAKTVVNAI